jgi:hypothetical protein
MYFLAESRITFVSPSNIVTGMFSYNHNISLVFDLYDWRKVGPMAVRSKEWVCGRSIAGIAGSNPTGDMNVCLL